MAFQGPGIGKTATLSSAIGGGPSRYPLALYIHDHPARREGIVKLLNRTDSIGGTDINAASEIAIPFDNEVYRDTDFYDAPGTSTQDGRLIVSKAGDYKVSYNVVAAHAMATLSGSISLYAKKNGSTVIDGSYSAIQLANKSIWSEHAIDAWYFKNQSPYSAVKMNHGMTLISAGEILNSGSSITVDVGLGRVMLVVNSGSDVDGTVTVTGTEIDQDAQTGTPSATDTLTITTASTDNSANDADGNNMWAIEDAYVTAKWFKGSVTISTTDVNFTDVDVYMIEVERMNKTDRITPRSWELSYTVNNTSAAINGYFYRLKLINGSRYDIERDIEFNHPATDSTVVGLRYEKREALSGTLSPLEENEGFFTELHFSSTNNHFQDTLSRVWCNVREFTNANDLLVSAAGTFIVRGLVADDYIEIMAIREGDMSDFSVDLVADQSSALVELLSLTEDDALGGKVMVRFDGTIESVYGTRGVTGDTGASTIDILNNGVSILPTSKLSIDSTEEVRVFHQDAISNGVVSYGDLLSIDVPTEETPSMRDLMVVIWIQRG